MAIVNNGSSTSDGSIIGGTSVKIPENNTQVGEEFIDNQDLRESQRIVRAFKKSINDITKEFGELKTNTEEKLIKFNTELDTKLIKFNTELDTKIQSSSKELEEKISQDKSSLLTIFGVFASIITFLSIEFQILKDICDPARLVGTTILICGVMLSFVVALQYITKSRIQTTKSDAINKSFKIFILINLSVIAAGVTLMQFGPNESEISCLNKKDEVIKKYEAQQIDYNIKITTLENNISGLNLQVQSIKNTSSKTNGCNKNTNPYKLPQ